MEKEVRCRECGKKYRDSGRDHQKIRVCPECLRQGTLTPENVVENINENMYLCKTKGQVLEDICFYMDYSLTQDWEVQHNVVEALFKFLWVTHFFSRRKLRQIRRSNASKKL